MRSSAGVRRGIRRTLIGGLGAAALALAVAPNANAGVSALTARGSAEQVQVTGATPGAEVKLVQGGEPRRDPLRRRARRRRLPQGRARRRLRRPLAGDDDRLLPGLQQQVEAARTSRSTTRRSTTGYGYLTTRDGTKLAINVHLPVRLGPVPDAGRVLGLRLRATRGRRESGIQPVAEALGYAVVDVNMRGTGCSGGAFDYFEPLQSLDGYDIVETVARQPWVAGGKVGMLGISYGGISQLFVAATQPPHLAAITPLSVIDNSSTTLYPGGILNTGFALAWAQDRVDDVAAGVADDRAALGLAADPGRRHDLRREPGPPSRGGQPASTRPTRTATTGRRSPTRCRR